MRRPKPPALSGRGQWRAYGRVESATATREGGRVVGPASSHPVEELLGAPFHVEAGVLLGLVARKPRYALHEIEDALCRAQDYAEVHGGSPCAATFLTRVCTV